LKALPSVRVCSPFFSPSAFNALHNTPGTVATFSCSDNNVQKSQKVLLSCLPGLELESPGLLCLSGGDDIDRGYQMDSAGHDVLVRLSPFCKLPWHGRMPRGAIWWCHSFHMESSVGIHRNFSNIGPPTLW
jgi:hypothetical protein